MEIVLCLYATKEEWIMEKDIASIINDQIVRKLRLDSKMKTMMTYDPEYGKNLVVVTLLKKDAKPDEIEYAKKYMKDVKTLWARVKDCDVYSDI